jgi:thiol-disulfide isomerase/thioredoxin/predicted negative regulator of RcsB-dependent stress response
MGKTLFACITATLLLADITSADKKPPEKTDSSQAKFAFHFASLTDPACPVTTALPHTPVTHEIHILYYPMAELAVIKEPTSLLLHVVLGHEIMPFDAQTISFAQRDDGVWVAKLSYEAFAAPKYAIYWVEEPGSKLTDTNGGEYFEVPFCDLRGNLLETNVKLRAQSYTGLLEAHGIERPVNYAKAIEILDDYIHAPARGQDLIDDRWKYELALRGDTAASRDLLTSQINQFVNEHAADGFGLLDALNFVGRHPWVPDQIVEKLLQSLEEKNPKVPQFEPRKVLLELRAASEPIGDRRTALLREMITEFPKGQEAMNARMELFARSKDLVEREKIYSEMRQINPEDMLPVAEMANAYLQANQKLPQALALLDEAERLLDANSKADSHSMQYTEQTIKFWKGRIAVTRADILVRQGKPAEALAILQPRKSEFHLGWSFYVYGRALEGTGHKREAVDAYLQSVVRASQYQEDANARLEKLWRRQKLGSRRELQQRVDALSAQSFENKQYRPQLLKHAAPEFELTTLQGEKFDNAHLRGKKIILNFWAVWCGPCRAELKELEDFQRAHPELVVLTAVDSTANSKDLKDLIHEQHLSSLRIAPTPPGLMEKFGAQGFPNTFVIDEKGLVRIEQLGVGEGISRYLIEDLEAIRTASD